MSKQELNYQLIFHGPADNNPDKLRRIKFVLISELGLNIDQIKKLFADSPAPIRQSQNQDELEKMMEILIKAGAIATITSDISRAAPTVVEAPIKAEKAPIQPIPTSATPKESEWGEGDLVLLDDSGINPLEQKTSTAAPALDLEQSPATPSFNPSDGVNKSKKKDFKEVYSELTTLEDVADTGVDLDLDLEPEAPAVIATQNTKASKDLIVEQEKVGEALEQGILEDEIAQEIVERDPRSAKYVRAHKEEFIDKRTFVFEFRIPGVGKVFSIVWSVDFVVCLVLSVAVLLAGNILYFNYVMQREDNVNIENAVAALLSSPISHPAEPIVMMPPANFTGVMSREEYEDKNIEARFVIDRNVVKYAKIVITTPKVPALTPHEIVHGKIRDPWIMKVDVERLGILTLSNGKFQGKGNARIYVDYEGQRRRVLGTALVTGVYDPQRPRIAAEITVFVNYETAPEEEGTSITVDENGEFRLRIKGQVVAETKTLS